ncbi:MAG: purine-nucleoside phosphorylase [Longimicrobiales bacterium]
MIQVDSAVDLLRAAGGRPRVGLVLGSGLSGLIDHVADRVEIPFREVLGLPEATVDGHEGRFVFGFLAGVPIALLAGRLHAYEGCSPKQVVAPTRMLAGLGVDALVVTNAAGGIHPRLDPGDLVLLDDYIDLTFRAPLTGQLQTGEERCPDMSAPFDEQLRGVFMDVAVRLGVQLHPGTYCGVLGPQYETAAEVRMLASLGADVVGMSTVPEVIAARASGIRLAGVSLVTNRATGLGAETLVHEDVLAVGAAAGDRLGDLVTGVVAQLGAVTPQTRSG